MKNSLARIEAMLEALIVACVKEPEGLASLARSLADITERSGYVSCKRCKLEAMNGKLDTIIGLLNQVLTKEGAIVKELDDLEVEVKANTDAEQAAVVLLGKLSDLIKAAGTDPVKLKKLTDDLSASKDSLAAAILANTPANPTP